MTPALTRITLTIAAAFVLATPINSAVAATDKSDVPQPPMLSKEDPVNSSNSGSSQSPTSSPSDASGSTGSSEKTAENPSLYWYDGKRKRMLSLDADTLADFGSNPLRPAAKPKLIDQTAATLTKSQAPTDQANAGVSPMFKDASSGQYAGALPGGVMVRTLRPMNIDTVMGIARAFGSSVLRPIGSPAGTADGAHDFWLFEAGAGLAALELANRIHESGQVSSAAPNWWKPRQRK